MRWLARFVGWSSFLAVPCYLVMTSYQHALASLAMEALELAGSPAHLEVDLHEPFSLGLFAAMCLASSNSPRRDRLRAVILGVLALAAFGLFAVLVFVVANRLATGHAGGNDGVVSRFIETILETVPWVSAPAMWLVLLGRWELPQGMLRSPRPRRRHPQSPIERNALHE